MKQLARRASLVVVLFLASVGTASGECAWVLWMTIGTGWTDTGEMTRIGAFTTSRECERVISQSTSSHLKIGQNRTGSADAGVVYQWRAAPPRPSNEEPLTRYEWRCWPDSVDPRSKEGKWVLWTRPEEPFLLRWWNAATWTPHSAYETKDQCEGFSDIATPNAARRCLPDTIDPRGPKGK
jgi:hypothetical protein